MACGGTTRTGDGRVSVRDFRHVFRLQVHHGLGWCVWGETRTDEIGAEQQCDLAGAQLRNFAAKRGLRDVSKRSRRAACDIQQPIDKSAGYQCGRANSSPQLSLKAGPGRCQVFCTRTSASPTMIR